jgi:hypothetical protein
MAFRPPPSKSVPPKVAEGLGSTTARPSFELLAQQGHARGLLAAATASCGRAMEAPPMPCEAMP